MSKINILLLGGTGYLGNAIYLFMNNDMFNIICFGRNDYNANVLSDNEKLLAFINNNNIKFVIDFTRNTKIQLVSFMFFIKKLPIDCTYVNISTYGIIYPNIYLNENEYQFVKKYIETHIRINDSSIRVPVIEDNIIDINFDDVNTNFVPWCSCKRFCEYIYNFIQVYKPGLYTIPAELVFNTHKI